MDVAVSYFEYNFDTILCFKVRLYMSYQSLEFSTWCMSFHWSDVTWIILKLRKKVKPRSCQICFAASFTWLRNALVDLLQLLLVWKWFLDSLCTLIAVNALLTAWYKYAWFPWFNDMQWSAFHGLCLGWNMSIRDYRFHFVSICT